MISASKNQSEFKIIIRGVRGSYPVGGKDFVKYGGSTSCYEIWAGGSLIIVDAGTGIVNLGKDLMRAYIKSGSDFESRTSIEAVLLFSHVHVDHTQGLPFFSPIFLPDSTFYIYGPDSARLPFEEAITSSLLPPYLPVSRIDMHSLMLFRSISQIETVYWSTKKGIPNVINGYREFERKKQTEKTSDIKISSMKSYAHPNEGVLVYKIEFAGKSIVIATDTEGYVYGDTRLINFSKGVDLLLHDAGYLKDDYKSAMGNKQGFGHSTMEMAVEVAKSAGVKKLGLVHHDPNNNDKILDLIDTTSKKLFPNSFAAYEGQVIKL